VPLSHRRSPESSLVKVSALLSGSSPYRPLSEHIDEQSILAAHAIAAVGLRFRCDTIHKTVTVYICLVVAATENRSGLCRVIASPMHGQRELLLSFKPSDELAQRSVSQLC
jgi:hypothetical protein